MVHERLRPLLELISKIEEFSRKGSRAISDVNWELFIPICSKKTVFIFRETNNQLLVSTGGHVERWSWDFLVSNSVLIERKDYAVLFKLVFADEHILLLKVDGEQNCMLFVAEDWVKKGMNRIQLIMFVLADAYLKGREREGFIRNIQKIRF